MDAWKAFDNYDDSAWCTNGSQIPCWLKIFFNSPKIVRKFSVNFDYYASSTTFVLQGSNDNNSWFDLTNKITCTKTNSLINYECTKNIDRYSYYRLYISAQTLSGGVAGGARVRQMQLYGS